MSEEQKRQQEEGIPNAAVRGPDGGGRGEVSRDPAGADGKSLQRQTGNFRRQAEATPTQLRGEHAASNTAALAEARKLPQTTTAGAADVMC